MPPHNRGARISPKASLLTPGVAGGFALVVVVLLFSHFVGIANLRRVSDATEDVAHTFQLKATLEQLLATLDAAETAEREFVVTGDRIYLEPYERARAEVTPDIQQLRRLTTGNGSGQQDDLGRLAALVSRTLSQLAVAVELRQRAAVPAGQATVASGAGTRLMADVRAMAQRLATREDELLSARTVRASDSYRSALLARYVTSALALLAIIVLFAGTRRFGVERQRATEAAERLSVTLGSIGDGVLTTDAAGRITAMNAVAQALTGWTETDAIGKPFDAVFVLLNEESRQPAANPIAWVLREGVIAGLANHTVLVAKDGRHVPIDDSAAPVRTENGDIVGVVMVFRDITQRRQMERERADRDRVSRQLAAIVESSADAIVGTDLDGTITSWNSAAERMYGFAAPEAIGKPIRLIVPDDRVEEEDRVFERIGRGERVEHFETVRQRKDGSTLFVSLTISPVYDATGHIVGASKTARDITDQQRRDERFRLAIEAAPNAMIMVDQRGTVVLANSLTEELLGYARDELVGQSVDRFVPMRHRERHGMDRASFFAQPRPRPMGMGRDLYALRKNGSEVPVEIGLSPIETADGLFVVAAVTDISERKRAEEALRAKTQELERVLDLIPAAVWISNDPECHEVVGNRSATALFGSPEGANLSQTPAPGGATIPLRYFRGGRELSPTELPMQRAAATRAPQPNQELDVELPDGRRIAMLGGAVPLLDEAGMVRGVVSAFSDITERRQIEVERAELLRREQQARTEIERASQLKDEFLAVLSHELRTPLNAVVGYAHLLGTGALSPERAKHAIQAIQRNAQAQSRLVESLLDLSRIIAGKLELDETRLQVSKLVESALDVVRPEADAKSLVVDVQLPPDDVAVLGDANRLQQVLWNLLTNAIKFTPPNGRIAVRVTEEASQVRIAVSDTGYGIAPEFLPHVFQRFKQASDPERRAPAGLGLGLAVVRELVQAHGGSVVAESAGQGRGSTFSVTLPVPVTPTHHHAPGDDIAHLDAAESLDGIDVLVVDDDGDMRELLALLLESRGARVRAVPSVDIALEEISRRRPDVLLADILMPERDGYSLIRRIRGREHELGETRLPAIAVTAYASASDRDRVLAAGYDCHVAKPADLAALLLVIARLGKTQEV